MPITNVAHFTIDPTRLADAEKAMFAVTTRIRETLPGAQWTIYRDRGVNRFIAVGHATDLKADGTKEIIEAMTPFVVGAIEVSPYDLVASSDLGRRPPSLRRGR